MDAMGADGFGDDEVIEEVGAAEGFGAAGALFDGMGDVEEEPLDEGNIQPAGVFGGTFAAQGYSPASPGSGYDEHFAGVVELTQRKNKWVCTIEGCDKSFMRKIELEKHITTHGAGATRSNSAEPARLAHQIPAANGSRAVPVAAPLGGLTPGQNAFTIPVAHQGGSPSVAAHLGGAPSGTIGGNESPAQLSAKIADLETKLAAAQAQATQLGQILIQSRNETTAWMNSSALLQTQLNQLAEQYGVQGVYQAFNPQMLHQHLSQMQAQNTQAAQAANQVYQPPSQAAPTSQRQQARRQQQQQTYSEDEDESVDYEEYRPSRSTSPPSARAARPPRKKKKPLIDQLQDEIEAERKAREEAAKTAKQRREQRAKQRESLDRGSSPPPAAGKRKGNYKPPPPKKVAVPKPRYRDALIRMRAAGRLRPVGEFPDDIPMVEWERNVSKPIAPDSPDYEKLQTPEIEVCAILRITPTQYLSARDFIVSRTERVGFLRKKEVKTNLRMDVNKAGKLYDWMAAIGWIPTPAPGAREPLVWDEGSDVPVAFSESLTYGRGTAQASTDAGDDDRSGDEVGSEQDGEGEDEEMEAHGSEAGAGEHEAEQGVEEAAGHYEDEGEQDPDAYYDRED